jgi:hypothetical protein
MPPPIPTNEPLPPVLDNADAPVVFADVLEGGGPFNGNLNLTFSVLQLDHTENPPTLYRPVCLRLVVPASTAEATARFIDNLLKQGQGGLPTTAPSKATLN